MDVRQAYASTNQGIVVSRHSLFYLKLPNIYIYNIYFGLQRIYIYRNYNGYLHTYTFIYLHIVKNMNKYLDTVHVYAIWFPKMGVPQNGLFIAENPIKMDDFGVPPF